MKFEIKHIFIPIITQRKVTKIIQTKSYWKNPNERLPKNNNK